MFETNGHVNSQPTLLSEKRNLQFEIREQRIDVVVVAGKKGRFSLWGLKHKSGSNSRPQKYFEVIKIQQVILEFYSCTMKASWKSHGICQQLWEP